MKTPLQDIKGIITPSSLHYVVYRFHRELPDIDPRQHRLLIHGLVDRLLIFTMEDLKRLPSVTRVHFVECAGNGTPGKKGDPGEKVALTVQQAYGLTSCSEWTGVLLSTLLKEAGVQKSAKWFLAEGADAGHHSKSHPLEKAMDDALIAYGQNGEALRPEQGYPLRLLVPGWEGVGNVKWLRRIKVTDEPYMAKDETVSYPSMRPDGKARWFQFEMGVKSVITFPSGGQKLPGPGFYEISGLAWSGGGAISRVEVSTDGGRTWKNAQIQEPVHRIAHTRFRFPWNWDGEEAVLHSRSTDERGTVQPTVAELDKLFGGSLDEWRSSNNINLSHFNGIQPWKVNRDGSVYNVQFS